MNIFTVALSRMTDCKLNEELERVNKSLRENPNGPGNVRLKHYANSLINEISSRVPDTALEKFKQAIAGRGVENAAG